jgi:hypothetical protein
MRTTSRVALVAASLVLTLAAAAPASADSAPVDWLDEVPDVPAIRGEPGELTPGDISALAAYQREFPWEEAFNSFGCDPTFVSVSDQATYSLTIDCAEATIDLDQVGAVPATVAAAAAGNQVKLANHPAALLSELISSP